jgi:hypothetical protein
MSGAICRLIRRFFGGNQVVDMHRNTLLVAVSVLLLFLSSCGITRKGVGAGELREMTAAGLAGALEDRSVKAQYMEAKAKIDYADGQQSVSANALLRMKKDEYIWMSIKKLGFEVGRVLITKDSAFILNRLNNEYYAEPLTYVEETFNLPGNLTDVQQLLMGNPIVSSKTGMQLEVEDAYYALRSREGNLERTYQVDRKDMRLSQMQLEDKVYLRRVLIGMSQYADIAGNQKFAYLRSLELESPASGKMTVSIQFADVVLNVPKEIKFDIPEKYTRVSAR